MTMRIEELIAAIEDLRPQDLEIWMQQALVTVHEEGGSPVFDEAECARVRLICSLCYDMEIEEGTLPLILELVDQLHEARQRLYTLGSAVLQQNEETRAAILAKLQSGEASKSD